MKKFKKFHVRSVLFQWIMTCIIILLIPFISILINYSISKKLIGEQVENSNNIILSHMQNMIDSKLQSIRNLNYMLLLDDRYVKLSTLTDTNEFFTQSQICYDELKRYQYVYNDLGIMLYYPSKDYVVTTGVSSPSLSIYNSMKYSTSHEFLPYEEWVSLIGADYSKSSYFFSEYCNYNNASKNSVIFGSASPFVSKKEDRFNILVSSSIGFIESDLSKLPGKSFFICDQNGTILQQFGTKLENLHTFPVSDAGSPYLTLDGTEYYCSMIPSESAGWYYILCSPSSLYLHDSRMMRNLTMFTTCICLLVGIAVIIYTQYRNYQPVKQILNIIPTAMKSEGKNEFQQIEFYHGELQQLNSFMQNKLNNISKNAQELYFYSKLKGVHFHTYENDIVNTLDMDFSGKHFVIASIYADSHNFQNDDIMKNWNLLQFTVNNVSEEVLHDHFPHEQIQDDFFHVYFFILDDGQAEEWKDSGVALFKQIWEFFRSQFQIDLFITISPVFDNFEETSVVYSDMLTSFETSYAGHQPGICTVSPSSGKPFFSDIKFRESSREISLAVFQHDLEKATSLVHDYICYLQKYDCSPIIIRYNIYSLIASILMDSGNYISQATRDTVESFLSASLSCTTLEEYETHIRQLFLYLCEQQELTSDTAQNKETLLVKKIKNYVENYYSDYSLNVTAVADAINLSPNYMSKIFKNNTGEGLLSYINKVRINHATELLRTTNISVDEIALMVGFSNSRSFRRNFQNLTGITATDYRNGVR